MWLTPLPNCAGSAAGRDPGSCWHDGEAGTLADLALSARAQYVVAPYEADPQLAYLEQQGLVDGIITEDSDLLIFGCHNVLFKMDNEGQCVEVRRDNFARCREYNFAGWTDVEFRQMAILSGCDYLDSVHGMGLKTAYKLMRKYKSANKVIDFVRLEGKLDVPATYMDDFKRAELTFRHQRVFDPVRQCLTHLHPLPQGMTADDLPFIGEELELEYARGVARGDIDPLTKLRVVDLVQGGVAADGHVSPAFEKTATAQGKFVEAKTGGKQVSIASYFQRAVGTPTGPHRPVASTSASRVISVTTPIATKPQPEPVRTSVFFSGGFNKGKARAIDPELSVTGPSPMVDLTLDDDAWLDRDAELELGTAGFDFACDEVAAEDDFVPGARGALEAEQSLVDLDLGALFLPDSQEGRRQREVSVSSSVAPISSPPGSPVPPSRSLPEDEMWLAAKETDSTGDSQAITEFNCSSPLPSAQVKRPDEVEQLRSSPLPSPIKLERSVKPARVAAVVKEIRLSDLSSDPIDCSSDGIMGSEDDDASADTPRARARPAARRSSASSWGSQRRKPGASQREEFIKAEEAEAEPAALSSRAAVKADWRAKFTLNKSSPASAKPIQVKPDPDPDTPIRQPMRRSLTYNPIARVPLQPTSKPAARQPFAPRTNHVESVSPPPERVASRPLKKRPSQAESDEFSSSPRSSGSDENSGREKVVVTNKRLLAFKWSGSPVGSR